MNPPSQPAGAEPSSEANAGVPGTLHQIVRVRHELRRRKLTVSSVESLTPLMRRIRFTSPELGDFHSPSPDDHIKLFFPQPDGQAGEPAMRDFTPRAFDNAAKTLTIDFALHGSGPATEWAARAQAGQTLDIGGPRGSNVVPDDFDWYLLVGDESALPAIGRWVEMLRPGVPVTTVVAVAHEDEQQTWVTRASWRPSWAVRGEPSVHDGAWLRRALDAFSPPAGDGFVWIAGEASAVRELRTHFVEERRHPSAWLKAAAYWHRGENDSDVSPSNPGSTHG
ncbi:siderophore-interacting protein [Stigmatella hybrida]|uniref:siderophore-interacting protein n=1 Tax=Stigmatella hybrida TaxID=394097 RepID=UPI001CDADF54|nr:siderophore-interacting protein [Stigmatella hybrida]